MPTQIGILYLLLFTLNIFKNWNIILKMLLRADQQASWTGRTTTVTVTVVWRAILLLEEEAGRGLVAGSFFAITSASAPHLPAVN